MKTLTTRKLAVCAMLIALQVVLSKFLMVQLTPSLRLSIDAVPILLAGLWFGVLPGALVGTLSDLVGTVLFPTAGAYFPPLTAAFLLLGVCAGLWRRYVLAQPTLPRFALMVATTELVASLFYKSLALSWLVGAPFSVLLASRALPVCGVAVIDTLLTCSIHRLVSRRLLFEREAQAPEYADQPRAPMTYDEALTYIHHVTWRTSRLGLERTRELLDRVGSPDKQLEFIHIAGTNGKGSTAAMLASILQSAGYRTGLYTSPFITRFNERMRVNGADIPDDTLARITEAVKPVADAMADHPTEFELITVIALLYFAESKCDVVVLEVGMGGEFDSTNVISVPELAVITNIGLDHTRELGPTMADIARAKAGIIKEGGDVVCYGGNDEADRVLRETCAARHASLTFADHGKVTLVSSDLTGLRFDYGTLTNLVCPLVGSYQLHNAALALTAIDALRQKGWRISDESIRNGLAAVRWPARFEVLMRSPLFVADGGHNPQGVQAALQSLSLHLPGRKPVFLCGVMADKDVAHMIDQIAPVAAEVLTVAPHNPRAMDADELAARFAALGVSAAPCSSVEAGVRTAVAHAGKDGVVCALGSLYMLGDVREAVRKIAEAAQA